MTDKLTLTSDKPHDQQNPIAPELDQSEDRMRRALEQLGGGSAPAGRSSTPSSGHEAFSTGRKHRFVQDGDVVVTHVQGRRDRGSRAGSNPATPAAFAPEAKLTVAQDALAEERGLRQRAERAAQDAQAMIATLQTKLAHGEIALVESRDAVQAQAESMAKLQAEAQLHAEQVKSLETRLAAAEEEREALNRALQAQRLMAQSVEKPTVKAAITRTMAPRKIARLTRSVAQIQKARDPNAEEPQPVKWWLGNKD